jgi:hypothetical protein
MNDTIIAIEKHIRQIRVMLHYLKGGNILGKDLSVRDGEWYPINDPKWYWSEFDYKEVGNA